MTDSFYWPAIDILLWGLTSVYIQESGVAVPHIVLIILSGLVLWMVVWRSQYEITVNLLEEIWNNNIVNLFASPLTIFEWITAVIILGIMKITVSLIFSGALIWGLYQVNVFGGLGWWLLPFLSLLIIFGWAVGFFVAGLIMRFGLRIEAFAWTIVALVIPFSAVYYPLSALPVWAQKIAAWLPTSYIFEGMRTVLFGGAIDSANLIKSAMLTLVYLLGSIGFLLIMFKQAKISGLAKLE